MAAPPDPRRPLTRPGLISRLLTGIAQSLKWLLLSLLASILIEWLGMLFWWPEQGLEHSRQMLVSELHYLSLDFQRSWLTQQPLQFAQAISERFYTLVFEWTGVVDVINWITPIPAVDESGVRPWLHRGYRPLAEFVLAAMYISQVFAVRVAILMLAMPVFGLFAVVALVDGLIRRDLRRWGGGRESSFVYHLAKQAALPVITLAWVLYLALPFSVHPAWIILPFSLLFSLAVTVTASSFKKYL